MKAGGGCSSFTADPLDVLAAYYAMIRYSLVHNAVEVASLTEREAKGYQKQWRGRIEEQLKNSKSSAKETAKLEVLKHIGKVGVSKFSDVQEKLGIPRTTLMRAVRELEDRGILYVSEGLKGTSHWIDLIPTEIRRF